MTLKFRHHWLRRMVAMSAAAGALLPPCTVAQNADPATERGTPDTSASALEEIIVTGTFIRGAEPAGTHVVEVSSDDVQLTGATTTAQLLQSIPQFGAFNTLAFPTGAGNTVTTNRPNLRTLPGFNNSGGSTTLVLVDGQRIVGAGVTSTTLDPDIVPPGIIERVEIVPDGGSAVYGSDAVAGVMNFITRKSFDGLAINGRYGVADDYYQWDTNVTAGTSWDSGNAYVSYNYSEHDILFGRDRDYVRIFPIQSINGVPVTSISCSPGNVQQGGRIFALPFTTTTAVANTANLCDESDDATIYPRENRHSVLASAHQEFGTGVELELKGFYTERAMQFLSGPFVFAQSVRGATGPGSSPFFATHAIGPNQTVTGQFGADEGREQTIDLSTYGVIPTLRVELPGSWQARLSGSWGRSTTLSHSQGFSATTMTNAVTAGLFNPYDPTSSNPEALAALANNEVYGKTEQELYDIRAVIDGNLFSLPGGAVKLAVGAEYYNERFRTRKGEIVPGYAETGFPGLSIGGQLIVPAAGPAPAADLSRSAKAAFAEVAIPFFSADNAVTGIRELSFTAAGRFDDYSDVGDTFNPRFGLTYRPIDWVKLRGSWGESFVAPSLADAPEAELTQLISVPAAAFAPPADLVANGTYPPIGPGQFSIGARGNSPGIESQEATTLSVGVDLQPPILPGLNVGLTYYQIDFEGVIGLPPIGGSATADLYRNYPFLVLTAPTQQQIDEIVAQADIVPSLCSPLPNCVYAVLDIRKRNLGNFKLSGIDVDAKYDISTSFGSLHFGVGGTYELDREQSAAPGLPYSDLLEANRGRYRVRTSAGVSIGNLYSQATWNHSHGYDLDPSVGIIGTDPSRLVQCREFVLPLRL